MTLEEVRDGSIGALFAHIVGMLVLFVGLAFEWVSLESIRRSATPAQVTPWLGVLRGLPGFTVAAVGVTVISGLYLARESACSVSAGCACPR